MLKHIPPFQSPLLLSCHRLQQPLNFLCATCLNSSHTVDKVFFSKTQHLFEKLSSSLNLHWLSITCETFVIWPLLPFQVLVPVSPSQLPVFQLYQTDCSSCCEMWCFMFPWICLLLFLCILFLSSGISFYLIVYGMDFYSSLMTLLKCQSQQAFPTSPQ